jgi:hypothetical protein
MNFLNLPGFLSDEEKLLTEQHKLRSHDLTAKHSAEIIKSEQNGESTTLKARMFLRHASELINLSQLHLNSWLDLVEKHKISFLRFR